MLTAADIARMQADTTAVIGDNDVSITIRRGSSTLAAQTVRVERRRGNQSIKSDAPGSEETTADIIVVGDTTLDIQKDDRFTVSGVLYKVLLVRPNEMIGIQAEAEMTA